MDVFDIKVEKAKAILKYKRLQKITALFRFMEVCIFLFIISSISTQFPFPFKFSGGFFRRISITIFSPGFNFIIGNTIVLLLFLRYGQFSAQEDRNHNNRFDFSNGYVQSGEKRMNINPIVEFKKQGKRSIYEEIKSFPDLGIFEDEKKHRSHSEDLKRDQHEESHRKLRRTMTERCRKSGNHSEKLYSYAENEMSGDEFRRTVEAFISRQQRSLREEEEEHFSAIATFPA